MRSGRAVTTDYFRCPEPAQPGVMRDGAPFYFAWGSFSRFVSRPRRGAAPRPGHEIVSASATYYGESIQL